MDPARIAMLLGADAVIPIDRPLLLGEVTLAGKGKRMRRFVITDAQGAPYLERYVIEEMPDGSKVYLHIIHQSDDDRDMHDHPWDFRSFIVRGSYIDHSPAGARRFGLGDWNEKRATDLHRLELVDGPVTTVVFRGPKYRDWGFQTPAGWKDHATYLDEKFGPGGWSKEYE